MAVTVEHKVQSERMKQREREMWNWLYIFVITKIHVNTLYLIILYIVFIFMYLDKIKFITSSDCEYVGYFGYIHEVWVGLFSPTFLPLFFDISL